MNQEKWRRQSDHAVLKRSAAEDCLRPAEMAMPPAPASPITPVDGIGLQSPTTIGQGRLVGSGNKLSASFSQSTANAHRPARMPDGLHERSVKILPCQNGFTLWGHGRHEVANTEACSSRMFCHCNPCLLRGRPRSACSRNRDEAEPGGR